MNEQIKHQKHLMEYALLILEQSERETYEPRKKQLQKEYAETMSTLAAELISIGKVKVTIHEQITH